MKTFALALAMTILAASPALATDAPGGPGDNTGRNGAHAAATTGGGQSSGGDVTDGAKPGIGSGSN